MVLIPHGQGEEYIYALHPQVQSACGRDEDADLSIALHATTSSFALDLPRSRLEAETSFAVATVRSRPRPPILYKKRIRLKPF